ncbi:MAG: hypothetical protein AAF703_07525 [Cyanobacteria bacterium P01_D01_bin.105]
MKKRLTRIDFLLGIALIASALIVGFFLSVKANFNLINGRYALFMDERITFDGVRRILHPQSFSMFVSQVIDGGDHRYGRILWNMSSLFSYLPERLWGESGQIFSTRMVQAVAQISAFVILIFTFLRSWTLRGIGLWVLIALPMTPYYATMPKPEPCQLLCLALFLSLAYRHSLKFGYYWLFLGLAFGSKVSALTVLPLFILIGLIQQRDTPEWIDFPVSKSQSKWLQQFFQAGLFILGTYHLISAFLLKWSLSDQPQPTLPPSAVVGAIFISCPFIIHFLKQKQLLLPIAWLRTIGIFCLGFWIAVPFTVLIIPRGIEIWKASTFLNTAHGSDDASVNFWTWIQYVFSSWTSVPTFLLVLLTLIAVGVVVARILSILLTEDIKILPSSANWSPLIDKHPDFLLLAISECLFIPIILFVERVWGMYLHLSSVFFVLGMLSACEILIRQYSKDDISLRTKRITIGLCCIFTSLQLTATMFYLVPAMTTEMYTYASRTTTDEFQKKSIEYNYLVNLFDTVAAANNRQILVSYDPTLFIPNSTDSRLIIEFWGPFNRWDMHPDLIAMQREHHPLENPPSETSASYQSWLRASNAYKEHVFSSQRSCTKSPCYAQIESELPELLLLVNVPQ